MYHACPRFAVAPGMVRCAGRVCARRSEHRADAAKVDERNADADRKRRNTINTSFTTLTQATARTPLAKTNATSRATATAMAGVRPMPSKLATETMMPTPVICSCR